MPREHGEAFVVIEVGLGILLLGKDREQAIEEFRQEVKTHFAIAGRQHPFGEMGPVDAVIVLNEMNRLGSETFPAQLRVSKQNQTTLASHGPGVWSTKLVASMRRRSAPADLEVARTQANLEASTWAWP